MKQDTSRTLFKSVKTTFPEAKFIKTLTGGLSNDSMVIEVNGKKLVAKSLKTDGSVSLSINSAKEIVKLSEYLRYGEYVNTPIVEVINDIEYQEFIEGTTLTNETIPKYLHEIAKVLANLHFRTLATMPEHSEKRYFNATRMLGEYVNTYFENFENLDPTYRSEVIETYRKEFRSIAEYNDLLTYMFSDIKSMCHNDALAANWIDDVNGHLHLIDHEYMCMNYPLFDLVSIIEECGLNKQQADKLISAYRFEILSLDWTTPEQHKYQLLLGDTEQVKIAIELLTYVQNSLWSMWAIVKAHSSDGTLLDPELIEWGKAKFKRLVPVNNASKANITTINMLMGLELIKFNETQTLSITK